MAEPDSPESLAEPGSVDAVSPDSPEFLNASTAPVDRERVCWLTRRVVCLMPSVAGLPARIGPPVSSVHCLSGAFKTLSAAFKT